MKLNHQFLLLCSIVASTFLFITGAHSFEGAYIGGAVGGILSPVNHVGDRITEIVALGGSMRVDEQWQASRKPSMHFTLRGGFGSLHGKTCKHYTGLEGSVNHSRYRMKLSKSWQNDIVKTTEELKLSLRDVDFALDYKQGYLVSKNTMIFVKAGVSRTRARLTVASESVAMLPHISETLPSYIQKDKIIHPLRIGFGVEHMVSDRVALTCDYIYSRYLRSFKLKGQTQTATPNGIVMASHNHKMTIQDTSIMFGLKTYF